MRTSATLAALCASSVLAVPALDKRWAFGAAGYDAESTDNVPGAQCVRKTYPISVTAEISVFSNVDSNANETVLAALRQEFVSALPSYSNFTNQYLSSGKTANKSGTYDISGILCTPNDRKGKSANAIQLLLHGIGFDSSYWNFGGQGGVPSSYSYAAAAAAAGYTTFRYDRLGTGRSEHPADAYNTVQAANDVQILVKIAAGLKDGSLTGTAYSSITGIGHSYGSVQMNALTQISPNTLDTVILTGFSANTSAVPLYLTSTAYSTATEVAPSRFGDSGLTNAYLITLAPQTNQLNFFYYPYFTNEAFALARATEQPVTNGVLYTFGAVPGPAPSFKGNVYVVTGAKDFIFCYTNCYAVPQGSNRASILDYVSDLYPSAAKFNTYIPANTGHGIAGHKSAPSVNAQITSYLEGIGFGSS